MIICVPNDYNTIQGAVDAANPGDTILVRPGFYREEVEVETDNLLIKGSGPNTVLHPPTNPVDDIGFLVEADNVEICGFTIRDFEVGIADDGNYSNIYADLCLRDNSDTGIFLDGTKNTLIRNVSVSGSEVGLVNVIATGVDVENSCFLENEYGIYDLLSFETRVTNSEVAGNTYEGFLGELSGTARLENNVFARNGYGGVTLYDNYSDVVDDNRMFENGLEGIFSIGAEFENFRDNLITRNGADGIFLGGNESDTVEFNHITRNAGVGIELEDTDLTTVRFNRLACNEPFDIVVTDGANNVFDANRCTEGSLPPGLCH